MTLQTGLPVPAVAIANAKEGVKHDTGKTRLGLISPYALLMEAKVMTFGAHKYAAHNWRKGMDWSRLIDAALRHITAFNAGEDNDPETGLPHLAHARCCLAFLLEYSKTRPELDDRFDFVEAVNDATYRSAEKEGQEAEATPSEPVRATDSELVSQA